MQRGTIAKMISHLLSQKIHEGIPEDSKTFFSKWKLQKTQYFEKKNIFRKNLHRSLIFPKSFKLAKRFFQAKNFENKEGSL